MGVLVNGMGGTPLMEQFVFMNDVLTLLEDKGVQVTFHKVGNYMTSIDMQGLSLTMIDLATKRLANSARKQCSNNFLVRVIKDGINSKKTFKHG